MRKFNYYMAAFVFAAGVSASLTSCIDTEEPDGIKSLREAKAGFINAETALKQADVAYREAETAYKQVEVAIKKVAQLTDELTYAKAEASKETDIELAKATSQVSLEQKKKEYEDAVKNLTEAIENNKYSIAQNARKNAEKMALLAINEQNDNTEFKTAYEALYGNATNNYQGTIYKLADAQEKLALAITKNYQTSEDALNATVEAKKMVLVFAQQAEQKVKDLFDDIDASKWYEQYQELEDDKMAQTYKDEQLKIQKKTLEQEKSALEAKKTALEKEYGKDLKDYNEAKSIPSFAANDAIYGEVGDFYSSSYTDADGYYYEFNYNNGVYTLSNEVTNEDLSGLLDEFAKELKNHHYADKNFLESKRADVIAQQQIIEDNKAYADETDYKDWQTALSDYNKNKNNTTLSELDSKSATLFGTFNGTYTTTQFYAPSVSSDKDLIKDYTGSSKYVLWLKASVAKAKAEEDYTQNYGAGATLYSAVNSLKGDVDHVVDSLTTIKNDKLAGKDYTDVNDQIAAKANEIAKVEAEQLLPSAQRGYDDAIIGVIKTAFQQAGILSTAAQNLGDYDETTLKFKAGTALFDVTSDDFAQLKEKSLFNAKKDVTDAETEVKKAEALLKSFQDGTYDADVTSQKTIKDAEETLRQAEEANKAALKRFEEVKAALAAFDFAK